MLGTGRGLHKGQLQDRGEGDNFNMRFIRQVPTKWPVAMLNMQWSNKI